MELHPVHDQSFDRQLLALSKERHADAERRALRPLRDRVLESVLLALMMDREHSSKGFSTPDNRDALLDAGKVIWMNDAVFHALASMTVNEILQDIDLGYR